MRFLTSFALITTGCGSDLFGPQLPENSSGGMNSNGGNSTQGNPGGADDAGGGEGEGGTTGAGGSGGSSGTSGGSTGASSGNTTGGPTTTCGALLEKASTVFSSVGTLRSCDAVVGGAKISASLLNLVGRTIDNEGEPLTPCVEALCDNNYAYIAANALPHYDYVRTTPNALVETPTLFRIPLVPVPVAQQATADDAATLNGCEDAYDQYLLSSTTATTTEPSGLCALDKTPSYLYDTLASGRADYQRIACLDSIALVSSGVSVYGPNEAATPDPWGNPGYNYPNDLITDTYGTGAALDLCGGHSGGTMHYHAIKDACFEQDADGKPGNTYAEATADFDIEAALTDSCAGPSEIVGWAPDGYPIKGPCVCVERDGLGACVETRRARSAWAYRGLSAWGNDAGESAVLGKEGQACNADSDCCTGQNCHFSCSFTVVDDSGETGGSAAEKRCVLVDYSWCVHHLFERSDPTPSGATFAYLDRCNGFDGPDGYAYHATMTFPFILGCYHGKVPATDSWVWQDRSPGGGGGGGGSSGGSSGGPGGSSGGSSGGPGGSSGGSSGGPGGSSGGSSGGPGGLPPMCSPGMMTMCCGDTVCDGPETTMNCAADCS